MCCSRVLQIVWELQACERISTVVRLAFLGAAPDSFAASLQQRARQQLRNLIGTTTMAAETAAAADDDDDSAAASNGCLGAVLKVREQQGSAVPMTIAAAQEAVKQLSQQLQ